MLFTFKERFNHHVRYVLWIVRDLDHFAKSRSDEPMREWIKGLEDRYRPPHRNTCVKILTVIVELMDENLDAVIAATHAALGDHFIGQQADLWSLPNCTEAFACMRISMIIKVLGTLHDVCPIAAFDKFPENRHTGAALARWTKAVVLLKKMRLRSIALATLDGASNNKKAYKILRVPMKVCAPHDLQRSVDTGLGTAGKKSTNPDLKRLLDRNGKMVNSYHKSTVLQKALEDSHVCTYPQYTICTPQVSITYTLHNVCTRIHCALGAHSHIHCTVHIHACISTAHWVHIHMYTAQFTHAHAYPLRTGCAFTYTLHSAHTRIHIHCALGAYSHVHCTVHIHACMSTAHWVHIHIYAAQFTHAYTYIHCALGAHSHIHCTVPIHAYISTAQWVHIHTYTAQCLYTYP